MQFDGQNKCVEVHTLHMQWLNILCAACTVEVLTHPPAIAAKKNHNQDLFDVPFLFIK